MAAISKSSFMPYIKVASWLGGLGLLGIPAWLLIWRIAHWETLEATDPMFLAGCVIAVIAPPVFLAAVRLITKELLEAGWEFWVFSFVATLGPCLFFGLRVTRDSAPRLAPISFGFIAAALGAGILSWTANSIIQRRAERNRKREKKQNRKRRK